MNSRKSSTKNDIAWEAIFKKYNILPHIEKVGFYEITSGQINEFREARLMTKFDHKKNLPKLYEDNNLAILPITRGSYTISHFDVYKELSSEVDVIRIKFPDNVESLDYENITSEAASINCAYVSGMLANFVEDERLFPTVNGRMSSGAFCFDIRNLRTNSFVNVKVENSQVEIDGGFEGLDFLTLVEAKNALSDDFLIRQLYYPYRLWESKVTKEVKSIFLLYSNGVFNLYEYEFSEPNNYNSLSLVKQRNYTLEADDITLGDILAIMRSIKIIDEPKVPFPQADSFRRVINLCEILYENVELTRDDVTSRYDFNARQTNYYTDAGRYLGLIEKKTENGIVWYLLTDEGKHLFSLKYKQRQLTFVEFILMHKVFNQTLKRYLDYLERPTKSSIVSIMKASNLYKIKSDSTFERRASTVQAWIDWILDLPSNS